MREWRSAVRSSTRANRSSQGAQNWSIASVVGRVGVRGLAIVHLLSRDRCPRPSGAAPASQAEHNPCLNLTKHR
jgi:hypothetical protein